MHPSAAQIQEDLNIWMVEKGHSSTDAMQISRVLPDPGEFLRKLELLVECFKAGTAQDNSGYLAEVMASICESEVSCADGFIYTLLDHRIHLSRRSRNNEAVDHLVVKVASVLEGFFGKPQWSRRVSSDGTLEYEVNYVHRRPGGRQEFQRIVAHDMLTHLSVHAAQPAMDLHASNTLTTLDGWTWHFSEKRWVRNTLRSAMLRVCAKKREELDVSEDLKLRIWNLWDAIKAFEEAGGKSVTYGEEPSPQPVLEALSRLLSSPHGKWFKALYQGTNEDVDLTIYLIKQSCRCVAGLLFVELLIIYGAKRSGKDTFVSTTTGLGRVLIFLTTRVVCKRSTCFAQNRGDRSH